MPTKIASAEICGGLNLADGKNFIGDGRLVVAARLHIAHGQDRRHRSCLDALVHDRTAGRVMFTSISHLDGEGLKVPSLGHSPDPAFEAWAERNDEITVRLAGAAAAARRAIGSGEVVPRPRELVFDTAIRVPRA